MKIADTLKTHSPPANEHLRLIHKIGEIKPKPVIIGVKK
jgi:hypothetical protein